MIVVTGTRLKSKAVTSAQFATLPVTGRAMSIPLELSEKVLTVGDKIITKFQFHDGRVEQEEGSRPAK
ncbi:hypothetical protein [Parasphingorhabdus cellanae]|uniref:Uncharacterized protein n=1 Tax=Parasphingorhabdus cellanae TaxID=2806553 RepID=A0ABX7T5D6_9SPHN|nr:hypothetical protein [Parasphingorhabdus cellanae]QTD56799.1 hypothetical protein J4G78_04275 [Parasphingorhabdus cellanae]